MSRSRPAVARVLGLAVGAGLLLGAVPARASLDGGGDRPVTAESEALALLQAAARAGQELSYRGTQRVATWGVGEGTAVARVAHDPWRGSRVEAARPQAATAALDERLLVLLAASYDLRVAGPGRCTGRTAHLVEAARPDGTVAGRFWIDRTTGLLLRREVFDAEGARVRRSELVSLSVGDAARPPVLLAAAGALPGPDAARSLAEEGWQVPRTLPGGFHLFGARRQTGDVLHLSYSDGLSTTSLFAQRGALGTGDLPGFRAGTVGGRSVKVRSEAPQRVVWSGGGQVWTLVSDAPSTAVQDAVAALPHDELPEPGVRARLGRGLDRLGGLLNPFG